MAEQILPKYLFVKDIQEFKNSKIIKYLYTCELYLEGLS